MPTENWFPTPIYYNMIDNVEEVQKELLSLLEKFTFHKSPRIGWDKNSGTFSDGYNEGENMLAKYKPSLFLTELYKNLNLFFNDLNFVPQNHNADIIIKESWFTRTQKNEYHHRHLHAFSEISGVYYVKTNGNDGSIAFYPPSSILFVSKIYSGKSDTITYRPEVGKLLLWPSLLEHGVISNQTDDDRISLSFNISLRDKL